MSKTADASIYGSNRAQLESILDEVVASIASLRLELRNKTGLDPVEHCLARIKSEESMREKCRRRNLPESCRSALVDISDAIGIRVVCAFRSDVRAVRDHLVNLDGYELVREKDYIRHAKPNGYRSHHLILRTVDGRVPEGCEPLSNDDEIASGFYVEVQLRTISMDTWAALEHHLKYKKRAPANERLIVSELKRCADELASTDLSMQALRDLIIESS